MKSGEQKPAPRKAGWTAVYRVVRRIPAGAVSTYGRVAEIAGMPRAARQVGWALSALGFDEDVPWHRVINARGEISRRGDAREIEDLQRSLLESEGVDFDRRGRIDLATFGWRPGTRSRAKRAPNATHKDLPARKRAVRKKGAQLKVKRGTPGTAGVST